MQFCLRLIYEAQNIHAIIYISMLISTYICVSTPAFKLAWFLYILFLLATLQHFLSSFKQIMLHCYFAYNQYIMGHWIQGRKWSRPLVSVCCILTIVKDTLCTFVSVFLHNVQLIITFCAMKHNNYHLLRIKIMK